MFVLVVGNQGVTLRRPSKLMFVPLAAFLFAAALPAQDNAELLNRMKAMEDRIHTLETEIQTLKGQQSVPVTAQLPAAAVAPSVAAAPPVAAPAAPAPPMAQAM